MAIISWAADENRPNQVKQNVLTQHKKMLLSVFEVHQRRVVD